MAVIVSQDLWLDMLTILVDSRSNGPTIFIWFRWSSVFANIAKVTSPGTEEWPLFVL